MVLGLSLFRIFQVKLLMLMFSASSVVAFSALIAVYSFRVEANYVSALLCVYLDRWV